MSYRIEVALLQVTDTHATFSVTRSPDLTTAKMAIAGMMATVLKAERGGEYADWMGKLAPLASTAGATWEDRRSVHEKFRGNDTRVTEITVRFWTDDDSMFKLQPDGSYAVSMHDLTQGARRGPQPVEVKQQGAPRAPRKGGK
jgi:hypothetical protein